MSNRPFLKPTARDQAEFNRATSYAVNSLLLPEATFYKPVTLPANPVTGQVVFDSAASKLKCWDGSAWQALW